MGRRRGSIDWLLTLDSHSYTRESGVWLAVLWQALVDYTHPEPTRYQADAIHWFASERYQIGSFEWVCSALQLNADEFRTGLQNSYTELRDYIRKTNKRGKHAKS